jgi:iron complex transport system ATP-binding protein
MGGLMLSTENVSVSLGHRTVLRDVSLRIPCGSLVAIIGPNGAGKSTLLRTLTGELRPSRGQVVMAGRSLTDWTLRERAQRRAVLSQHSALAFPFSCLDVVLLGRTPHEDALPTADARLSDQLIARAALDLVELGHRLRDSYDTLSGGQRQLVQLARVLAQIWEPPKDGQRYLLLDEPTASLDLRYQHLALRCARQLSRLGAATLAILHDVNLAAQYADTLVALKEGRVVAQGPPREVLCPAIVREVFDVPVSYLGALPANQFSNHDLEVR